ALPAPRFVNVILREPVTRVVMDPSEALSTFSYSLAAGSVTRILNPQNNAGRVKGFSSWNSHLGPRPARAGEAVTTPPSMPSSAPSATSTPSRLMAITPHFAATDAAWCRALLSDLPKPVNHGRARCYVWRQESTATH